MLRRTVFMDRPVLASRIVRKCFICSFVELHQYWIAELVESCRRVLIFEERRMEFANVTCAERPLALHERKQTLQGFGMRLNDLCDELGIEVRCVARDERRRNAPVNERSRDS